MKKLLLGLSAVLMLSHSAFALPFLQLDVSNSTYDQATETVFSTGDQFTLSALVNSETAGFVFDAEQEFFISAALTPKVSASGNFGFFTFGGEQVQATSGMQYGTPPIEDVHQSDDLQSHGIYETYYKEFAFTLNQNQTAAGYNVEDSPGSFVADGNGSLFYMDFLVDVSGLASEYEIHFDLYTKNADGSIQAFAPFSHDAQSANSNLPPVAPVPEPGTIFLLGAGLLALLGFSRKMKS